MTRHKQVVRSTRTAFTTIAAIGALLGCSDSTSSAAPDKSGTFFGSAAAVGAGSARTYVILDRVGSPTELGIALTETALADLPAAAAEYVLTLPLEAAATAFKHAVINWMPTGHPPPMVYTVPHFDFHFYTISNVERVAIVLGDPVLDAKMTRQPTAEFVPAGYTMGMASAGMGLHWNDPDAPERHGEAFTKTFIYGSYDGAVIFGEPMVAKSYLEGKPAAVVTPVKLPAQYSARGYHPTAYSVAWVPATKEYRIALTGLASR